MKARIVTKDGQAVVIEFTANTEAERAATYTALTVIGQSPEFEAVVLLNK